RRVEGGRDGWAFGNPSSYIVTGVPLTDIQADGETVRSGFRRPTRLSRPANGQSGFELRHYPHPCPSPRGGRGQSEYLRVRTLARESGVNPSCSSAAPVSKYSR